MAVSFPLKKSFNGIYKAHRLVAETNLPAWLQQKGFSKPRATGLAVAGGGFMAAVYLAGGVAVLGTALRAAAQIAAALMPVSPVLGVVLGAAVAAAGAVFTGIFFASGLGLGRTLGERVSQPFKAGFAKLTGKIPGKKQRPADAAPETSGPEAAAKSGFDAGTKPGPAFNGASEGTKPAQAPQPPAPAPETKLTP